MTSRPAGRPEKDNNNACTFSVPAGAVSSPHTLAQQKSLWPLCGHNHSLSTHIDPIRSDPMGTTGTGSHSKQAILRELVEELLNNNFPFLWSAGRQLRSRSPADGAGQVPSAAAPHVVPQEQHTLRRLMHRAVST